jgi:hypothetical protein
LRHVEVAHQVIVVEVVAVCNRPWQVFFTEVSGNGLFRGVAVPWVIASLLRVFKVDPAFVIAVAIPNISFSVGELDGEEALPIESGEPVFLRHVEVAHQVIVVEVVAVCNRPWQVFFTEVSGNCLFSRGIAVPWVIAQLVSIHYDAFFLVVTETVPAFRVLEIVWEEALPIESGDVSLSPVFLRHVEIALPVIVVEVAVCFRVFDVVFNLAKVNGNGLFRGVAVPWVITRFVLVFKVDPAFVIAVAIPNISFSVGELDGEEALPIESGEPVVLRHVEVAHQVIVVEVVAVCLRPWQVFVTVSWEFVHPFGGHELYFFVAKVIPAIASILAVARWVSIAEVNCDKLGAKSGVTGGPAFLDRVCTFEAFIKFRLTPSLSDTPALAESLFFRIILFFVFTFCTEVFFYSFVERIAIFFTVFT